MAAANLTAPILTAKQIARFWSHVARGKPDDCWPWQASQTGSGYGHVALGRCFQSHVIARFLATGTWPYPLFTCHACDNKLCCNPAHLWLGTQADNLADMRRKGRGCKGNNHYSRKQPERVRCGGQLPQARLTAEQVQEIKLLCAAGHFQSVLAERFGICQQTISDIIQRRTWKHLPDSP